MTDEIFEYIPSTYKKFGTLIVKLPGQIPIHYPTTSYLEVEKHMVGITQYYSKLLEDIKISADKIKKSYNG